VADLPLRLGVTNRLDYCHRAFPSRVGGPLDGGARQLNPSTLLADGSANFQALLEDGERVFGRVGSHASADGSDRRPSRRKLSPVHSLTWRPNKPDG
jgi:hypothetical protein